MIGTPLVIYLSTRKRLFLICTIFFTYYLKWIKIFLKNEVILLVDQLVKIKWIYVCKRSEKNDCKLNNSIILYNYFDKFKIIVLLLCLKNSRKKLSDNDSDYIETENIQNTSENNCIDTSTLGADNSLPGTSRSFFVDERYLEIFYLLFIILLMYE